MLQASLATQHTANPLREGIARQNGRLVLRAEGGDAAQEGSHATAHPYLRTTARATRFEPARCAALRANLPRAAVDCRIHPSPASRGRAGQGLFGWTNLSCPLPCGGRRDGREGRGGRACCLNRPSLASRWVKHRFEVLTRLSGGGPHALWSRQMRFITRPKSRTVRATRKRML